MNTVEMEMLDGGCFWCFVTEKVLPVVGAVVLGGGVVAAASGNANIYVDDQRVN